MAWFADLSECTYFGAGCAKHLRAVGWLELGKPFAEGPVGDGILAKLSKLFEDPWQPVDFCGYHVCDLCPKSRSSRSDDEDGVEDEDEGASLSNLFVPAENTIYVCPEGILHYITKHGYAPPSEFNRAVMGCPPMGSKAYFAALKAQGGKPLVDGTCF